MPQLPGKGGERKWMMNAKEIQMRKNTKLIKSLNDYECCLLLRQDFYSKIFYPKDFSAVRAMAVLAIKHFQENLSVHLYVPPPPQKNL